MTQLITCTTCTRTLELSNNVLNLNIKKQKTTVIHNHFVLNGSYLLSIYNVAGNRVSSNEVIEAALCPKWFLTHQSDYLYIKSTRHSFLATERLYTPSVSGAQLAEWRGLKDVLDWFREPAAGCSNHSVPLKCRQSHAMTKKDNSTAAD